MHVRSARGHDCSNFCALVERAGLDPAKDLRYGNFSGADFRGCDLNGYDFTGAALNGCSFNGAEIVGATLIQCEFSGTIDGYDVRGHPVYADDIDEAWRLAQKSIIKMPVDFDKHIKCGAHFQDFEFSPLMHCVVLAQPDGRGLKLAIATSDDRVNAERLGWEVSSADHGDRLEDFADWLNRAVGFGSYFAYKVIRPREALLETGGRPKTPQRGSIKIEIDEGLTFITHDADDAQIASVNTGKLVRRMRATGCDLPLDFDER